MNNPFPKDWGEPGTPINKESLEKLFRDDIGFLLNLIDQKNEAISLYVKLIGKYLERIIELETGKSS